MKARSDNSFREHSHSGLHRFEDTDLGALEWRWETWVRLEPSNSRERSPCCACLAREAQVGLPKRSDVASPRPSGGEGNRANAAAVAVDTGRSGRS